jgi:hypothetical protein
MSRIDSLSASNSFQTIGLTISTDTIGAGSLRMRRQLHLDVVDRTPLVDGSKGILSLTAKAQRTQRETAREGYGVLTQRM